MEKLEKRGGEEEGGVGSVTNVKKKGCVRLVSQLDVKKNTTSRWFWFTRLCMSLTHEHKKNEKGEVRGYCRFLFFCRCVRPLCSWWCSVFTNTGEWMKGVCVCVCV